MTKLLKSTLTLAFGLMAFITYGQKGPGGVSDDSNNATNCRLWLDASSLSQADVTSVELWEDKSVSSVVDTAFWDSGQDYLPPDYRSDPAAGINGKPTISFESGGMLSIGDWPDVPTSADLNSNPGVLTTYEQSIFVAFRTSADVTSRQIIWEEGGSARGIKIYIVNQTIRIGVYDDINDNDPGPGGAGNSNGVRTFGFTWKQLPVQPNTTFVVSLVFDVPTGADNNQLITNTFNPNSSEYSGLNGTLNGLPFPNNMLWGGQEYNQAAVGGVFTHPDPVGIGGLNRTSYNENGPVGTNTPTGSFGFTGRISEICYYAFAVTACQRIIIENYLAAKYFANQIANDRYEYQTSYGDGVIGIGKQSDSDFHNTSQGDNIFEFSSSNFSSTFPDNAPNYILTGHNNNPLTWTDENVPDTLSVQRLRRVWRWDFSFSGGTPSSPELSIKIEPTELPALPAGFTEYGIMVERSNGFLPNFNETNSELIALRLNAGRYEADVVIEDGTHFTVVALKPQVQFTLETTFSIEGDNPPAPNQPGETLIAKLNFEPDPAETYSATIDLIDDNTIYGADYTAASQSINISFSGGNDEIPIPITIVNDNVEIGDDPIEVFNAIITSTSSNLSIGSRDSVRYRILDNDPPPKASFQSESISFNEVDGTYNVPVEIIGTFTGSPQVTVELVSATGTATPGVDYTVVSPQVLTFSVSNPIQNVQIAIIDDDIDASTPFDEFDEWFQLEITGASGVGFDSSVEIETIVNILDQDPEPTVDFQALSSEGYEAVSDPRIYVDLSAPSAKQIIVPFEITGGDALNVPSSGADYAAEESAILIIQPGEIEGFIYFDIPSGQTRLFIYSDGTEEPPETIEFTLSSTPGPTNAQLGSDITHVFTIRDYEPFENNGVAGIGKEKDNTFWMVADEAVTGTPSSIPNLSPRPISIIQNNSSRRPTVVADVLNSNKVLRFNSSQNDFLAVGNPNTTGQSSLINTAGQYDSKSIFMVFTPDNPGSSSYQTLYEQGGGSRGISIYVKSGRLFFQAWNVPNDDPSGSPSLSPWGHQSSNYAITESTTTLVAGRTYIISAHFQNNMILSPPTNEGLRLYVNGEKEDTYTGNVGRLYTHGGRTAIGCLENQSFYDDGANSSTGPARCFDGDIAEIIYFNEPNTTSLTRMNNPRIQIIHNYLAAKYDITGTNSNLGWRQYFDDSFTDATNSNNFFGNDLTGIGQTGTSESHLDSKGLTELRVSSPVWGGSNAYLFWGHNGESLTNTWPFSDPSNNDLPPSINERSGRVWKFFKGQDGISSAQFELNFEESDNSGDLTLDKNLLRLLVHNNSDPNDFSNASVYPPAVSQATGSVVRFIDIPISDGMYMALGNTSNYFNFPLPIELVSFDAQLKGTYVDLNWSTATEINNDYFVVERASEDLDWKPILMVTGAGNSNSLLTYSDKDRDPLTGLSYYRLKQVDFDGAFSYSDPVSVFNNTIKDSQDVIMYPNPSATGSVFLRLPFVTRDFETLVRLFDMSGKEIYSKRFDTSSDIFEFRYGELNPGIYLVNINSDAINETKKLIVE